MWRAKNKMCPTYPSIPLTPIYPTSSLFSSSGPIVLTETNNVQKSCWAFPYAKQLKCWFGRMTVNFQLEHFRAVLLPYELYYLISDGLCEKLFSMYARCNINSPHPRQPGGWSGGAMALGKLPVPGRPTIWMKFG